MIRRTAIFAVAAFCAAASIHAGSVSVPVKDVSACDAVVCGAGPAGCAAAIAARRSGLSVLLVEAQSRLGGTATSGGVSHWLGGRNDNGEWVVGGIFRELSLREQRGLSPDGMAFWIGMTKL